MSVFNRSQAWALALLVATFLAGAAAGWAVQARADDRGGKRRGADAMVEYLGRELDLTAAQRDSVRAVFARHKPAMDAIWRAVHPQMDSLRHAMRDQIAAQLDDAQKARYQAVIAELDQRRRHDSVQKADSTKRDAN